MDVILRAHPVRGASHIQRNTNLEVATQQKHLGHKDYNRRSTIQNVPCLIMNLEARIET